MGVLEKNIWNKKVMPRTVLKQSRVQTHVPSDLLAQQGLLHSLLMEQESRAGGLVFSFLRGAVESSPHMLVGYDCALHLVIDRLPKDPCSLQTAPFSALSTQPASPVCPAGQHAMGGPSQLGVVTLLS